VSDVKPEKKATGPQLADIFGVKMIASCFTKQLNVLDAFKATLKISRGFAALSSYECSIASSALQCTAKMCNCTSAQRWNCEVCVAPARDSRTGVPGGG